MACQSVISEIGPSPFHVHQVPDRKFSADPGKGVSARFDVSRQPQFKRNGEMVEGRS
jgi:hypothetical protein